MKIWEHKVIYLDEEIAEPVTPCCWLENRLFLDTWSVYFDD